jgi:hypothetical protein
MFEMRWKTVRLVACAAIVSTIAGACQGPHPMGATPDDRWGRGCPIPWGDESADPTDGNFVEIYSPHKFTADAVIIDLWPRGSNTWLTIEGEPQLLQKDIGYTLTFKNGASSRRVQLTEYGKPDLMLLDRTPQQLLPSKGLSSADGYLKAGMTIYKASADTFEFGLRINGKSLPVKISRIS